MVLGRQEEKSTKKLKKYSHFKDSYLYLQKKLSCQRKNQIARILTTQRLF